MNERTEDQKKELEKLRKQVARKNQNQENTNLDKEKDRLRKKELRQDDDKRKTENERKKVLRKDNEKNKASKEVDRLRKEVLRQNDENRKARNEQDKKRKKDTLEKMRYPFKMIAALESVDGFKEENIQEKIKSSYVGSLFDNKNQCKDCKAFRFKKERNFCCSQGDIVIPSIPEPPKELKKLYSNKKFTDKIRGYNNILAMASIGCVSPDNMKGYCAKVW